MSSPWKEVFYFIHLSLKYMRHHYLKTTCHWYITLSIILPKAACIQVSDFETKPQYQAQRQKHTLSNYWSADIASPKYWLIDITWPCLIASIEHVTHPSRCNWYIQCLAHLSLYSLLTTFFVSIFNSAPMSCIIDNNQQIKLKYKTTNSKYIYTFVKKKGRKKKHCFKSESGEQ